MFGFDLFGTFFCTQAHSFSPLPPTSSCLAGTEDGEVEYINHWNYQPNYMFGPHVLVKRNSIKTRFVLIDNNYSRILLIGMFAQLKTLFGGKTKTVFADICLGAGCHAIPSNTDQFHKIPCKTIKHHITTQYQAKPYNTMQYHSIPINTTQEP